jgi:Zn-dependent protease with chaperone function
MPDGDPPVQSPTDSFGFLQSGADPGPGNGTTTMRRDSIVSSEGPPNLAEARSFAAVPPTPISALRHPKESTYFTVAAIAGTLAWLCLIPFVIPFVIMFFWVIIPLLIGVWIFKQRYKAEMLGNSIKVSRNQYPEIFEIVERHCRALGLAVPPAVFVVNMNGVVNAIARKILKDKYVMLYSDLIDLMLAHGSTIELSSIIGHELGHHAAGHVAFWKQTLLKPAMCIPFLGGAYSRACELTADRIGLYLCGDKDAACRGLIALACGSKLLSPRTNLQAFQDQERELPWFFAFWNDLYSSHPRLTKRVMALEDAAQLVERSG